MILEKIVRQFPRLLKVFADGGYEGKDFTQKVKDDHQLLTIDYEALPATSEAFIYAAMVRVMVRRLA